MVRGTEGGVYRHLCKKNKKILEKNFQKKFSILKNRGGGEKFQKIKF
jgi:hypothetical protein